MARNVTLATATVMTSLLMSLSPALAQSNSLFGGGPRYDGTVTVTDLTGSACPAFIVSRVKGKASEAVFRARVKPTQLVEAMSVSLPMAGAALLVAEGDGYFKGKNKALKANFIIDAWPVSVKKGSVANLTFSPANPGPATVAEGTPSFTFTGRISNYAFEGCTAAVSGAFNLRTVP